MDIDFDYEITQIDDDTIGLAYTVNNSGDPGQVKLLPSLPQPWRYHR